VLESIDTWLTVGHSGRFMVAGAPGTGKSRLFQRLVELSQGTAPADGLRVLGEGVVAAALTALTEIPQRRSPKFPTPEPA
jgi:hypothetical protein